jgi:hypothetical protein
MMFDKVAQRMMEIMGKEVAARGVVTVEQMPECIARLKAAIAEDRARAQPRDEEADAEAGRTGVNAPVSLAQRALPLVELLERSLRAEKPVLWGV